MELQNIGGQLIDRAMLMLDRLDTRVDRWTRIRLNLRRNDLDDRFRLRLIVPLITQLKRGGFRRET